MSAVKLCKASAIDNTKPVEDVTISFVKELPVFADLKAAAEFYEFEAMDIADRLIDVLPGGVLDRVIIRLLEHKAGYLRIPMVK